ncbi:MAG TPA: homoserine dehydrogenase [Candidatus Limnocylindrales bacterium]|jgi:homoserine dehydrogenase|nr:homoserine dehydrogenase [Candidatus Limnocylindrales bacterium]
MSRPPLRVALLGAGTVGGAVLDRLLHHPDHLLSADGQPLVVTSIAVRDLARARDEGIPTDLLTDAPAHLVADPETDVIVELMGGIEPARTLIAAALGAGKPVVTANKSVIAHHGPALEAEARRTDTAFRFEAAVASGIPILAPLAADLAGNHIVRVRGIINGTTNYILSAMEEDGRPYEDVLIDAQELGYAEADPSGDVEGDDAANKLVILARLAFGRWLDPATVGRRPPTARGEGRPGITGVTDQELEGAAALGLTIKLLATATRRGDEIEAAVIPTAVPTDSPFGWTDGVTNRIEVEAEPLGVVRLAGPGAGGAATSSAILGDLVAIARGGGSTWAGLAPATGPAAAAIDPLDGPRHWYAFVPAVREGALPPALDEAAAVEFEDGTAIRSEVVTLAEAKAAFDSILPDGVDVTLYPVDD